MNSEKLGLNIVEKMLVAVIPVIFAVLFYFLPSILLLIKKVPFLSDNQLINFITQFESSWAPWVLAGIGLIIGIFLSLYIYTEILKMEVYRDYVIIDIFDKKSKLQKSEIDSVFKEGKKIVIINNKGIELLRENTDYSSERLKNSFQKYHYPWADQDPYFDEFFEWSVNHEDLNATTNDILYDRRKAKRDDEEKKVRNLRQDLMEMGIVVKDDGEKQYIRITGNRSSPKF